MRARECVDSTNTWKPIPISKDSIDIHNQLGRRCVIVKIGYTGFAFPPRIDGSNRRFCSSFISPRDPIQLPSLSG